MHWALETVRTVLLTAEACTHTAQQMIERKCDQLHEASGAELPFEQWL